jgi:hypothetical protein
MLAFEMRIGRATQLHRPQYLRIKAVEILDQSGDPEAWDVAASLLRRVIVDYPGAFDVPMAHVGLAEHHRRLSQWEEALRHYQLSIDLTSPRRSGSTGIEEVDMAEVLVERSGPGDNTRALELLTSEHLVTHRHFNSTLFRIALCRARAQSRAGLDPSAAAAEALRLASIAEPQLPRHPTVGLVDPDQQTLEELRRYASG